MDIIVVPAQGGLGTDVRLQANTQAERLARRLGGGYRLLHLPDGLTADATDGLARLPQVREVLELMRGADVLLYGVGFLTVGGEWFAMWQSVAWNGQNNAHIFFMLGAVALLHLSGPEA